MRLDEFCKCTGLHRTIYTCKVCKKEEAVIEWDCCKLLFCQRCAREFALGILRDVVAGEVGEQKAQDKYAEIRGIYG